jgi:hypothetical protein
LRKEKDDLDDFEPLEKTLLHSWARAPFLDNPTLALRVRGQPMLILNCFD